MIIRLSLTKRDNNLIYYKNKPLHSFKILQGFAGL